VRFLGQSGGPSCRESNSGPTKYESLYRDLQGFNNLDEEEEKNLIASGQSRETTGLRQTCDGRLVSLRRGVSDFRRRYACSWGLLCCSVYVQRGCEGCTWKQRSLGVCRPPLKRTECQQQQPNYLSSSSVKLICIENYRSPTDQIPSWEASSCSAIHTTPSILYNPMVHYRGHKNRYWSLSEDKWSQFLQLRGLSPQANYTDRATSACRRS
jgi:hypothetical protein